MFALALSYEVPIEATVDIQDNIDLNNRGRFSSEIRLPSGYSVDDILCESIECEGALAEKCKVKKKKKGKKWKKWLEVKFNIQDIANLGVDVNETRTIEFTVTGELEDGTQFEGSDSAKVKGKKEDGGGNGKGMIYGLVSSIDGPLEGAKVTCENRYFKDKTKTDAEGYFEFINLKLKRNYEVTIKKKGYEQWKRIIELTRKQSKIYKTAELLQKE